MASIFVAQLQMVLMTIQSLKDEDEAGMQNTMSQWAVSSEGRLVCTGSRIAGSLPLYRLQTHQQTYQRGWEYGGIYQHYTISANILTKMPYSPSLQCIQGDSDTLLWHGHNRLRCNIHTCGHNPGHRSQRGRGWRKQLPEIKMDKNPAF